MTTPTAAITTAMLDTSVYLDKLALFGRIGDEMFEGVSGDELCAVTGVLRRIQDNLAAMEQREINPKKEGTSR